MSYGVAALAAVVASTLAGCASPAALSDPDRLSVVASTTQVADFTRQVTGEFGEVTQLFQPNTSAHSFDPAPADLIALGAADVLVINGAGIEGWIDSAIAASGFSGVVVDAGSGLALVDSDEGEHTQDGEHADEGEHTQEGEHGDEGGDPHVWTSVRNAITMVEVIADGLADAEPAGADRFRRNADEYTAALRELDQWITQQLERVPPEERLLVSNHDSLGYFVRDYGIRYVGAVIPSFDDNAELSAADIDALVRDIRSTGTRAVYSEASLSPRTAETIAREAGVRVFAGEDALYADALGAEGSGVETYLAAQVHNVRQLMLGWGVEPDPAPVGLE